MTCTTARAAAPSFDLIGDVDLAGLKVAVVRTALELQLFDHIHRGRVDEAALANAVGATEDGIRVLTRALLSLGVLTRTDAALACTPTAEAYLRTEATTSFAPILLSWLRNRDSLLDAVRGNFRTTDHASESAAAVWRAYASPDLARWPDLVDPITKILGERRLQLPPNGAVLDLGCGSALVSLTLAASEPAATVVAVDRPEVLEVARELAAEMGLSSQLHCVAGEVQRYQPQPAAFDIILLGNVAQYLTDDELTTVLSRARTALRPGGALHLTTPVIDDGSVGWSANWNSAVEMFLSSPRVKLRDDRAIRQVFAAAGFESIEYWPPYAYRASI
jgi:C-methyltransferase